MKASIHISDRQTDLLVKFFSSDTYIRQLIESLKDTSFTIDLEKLIKDSLALTTGFTPEEVNSITRAIISLLIFRNSNGKPLEDTVNSVVASLKESGSEETEILEEDYTKVERNLLKILDIENLTVSAKAMTLAFRAKNSFIKADVLTEMLPIFIEADEKPKAAIISYQLNIIYIDNGEQNEISLKMDQAEVDGLIDELQKVKGKTTALQNFLHSTDLTYIENI